MKKETIKYDWLGTAFTLPTRRGRDDFEIDERWVKEARIGYTWSSETEDERWEVTLIRRVLSSTSCRATLFWTVEDVFGHRVRRWTEEITLVF